jgi:hypothetical protein
MYSSGDSALLFSVAGLLSLLLKLVEFPLWLPPYGLFLDSINGEWFFTSRTSQVPSACFSNPSGEAPTNGSEPSANHCFNWDDSNGRNGMGTLTASKAHMPTSQMRVPEVPMLPSL